MNEQTSPSPQKTLAPCPQRELPAVGGRRIDCSNATFERRALIALANEQAKLSPDNALVALYCDAVRLTREYSDAMNASLAPCPIKDEGEETARLDWLERRAARGGWTDEERRLSIIFPMETVTFVTLREAIDAAIKSDSGITDAP